MPREALGDQAELGRSCVPAFWQGDPGPSHPTGARRQTARGALRQGE